LEEAVTVAFVVGAGKELVTLVRVDGVDSFTPTPDRRRTYGPILFAVSSTVRSVVPHLNNHSIIENIYKKNEKSACESGKKSKTATGKKYASISFSR
jgi:hypothetical protein